MLSGSVDLMLRMPDVSVDSPRWLASAITVALRAKLDTFRAVEVRLASGADGSAALSRFRVTASVFGFGWVRAFEGELRGDVLAGTLSGTLYPTRAGEPSRALPARGLWQRACRFLHVVSDILPHERWSLG